VTLYALATGAAYYGIAVASTASFRDNLLAIAIVLTIEYALSFLNISGVLLLWKTRYTCMKFIICARFTKLINVTERMGKLEQAIFD
jgi:hypothetical protein